MSPPEEPLWASLVSSDPGPPGRIETILRVVRRFEEDGDRAFLEAAKNLLVDLYLDAKDRGWD